MGTNEVGFRESFGEAGFGGGVEHLMEREVYICRVGVSSNIRREGGRKRERGGRRARADLLSNLGSVGDLRGRGTERGVSYGVTCIDESIRSRVECMRLK